MPNGDRLSKVLGMGLRRPVPYEEAAVEPAAAVGPSFLEQMLQKERQDPLQRILSGLPPLPQEPGVADQPTLEQLLTHAPSGMAEKLLAAPTDPHERQIRGLTPVLKGPKPQESRIPEAITEERKPAEEAAPVAPRVEPAPFEQEPARDNLRRAEQLRGLAQIRKGARGLLEGSPTASDIFYGFGGPRRDVDTSELLLKAAQLEGKEQELVEGETDPTVAIAQKIYDSMGLSPKKRPRTEAQAQSFMKFAGMDQELEAFKQKREDQRAKIDALAKGDLSGLPEDRKKLLLDERQNFSTNARVKEVKERLDSAKRVNKLAATNPLAARAAMIDLARLSGEKGVLSNLDIQRWTQRPGLKGWYDKSVEFIASDITKGMRKEILEVAKIFDEELQKVLNTEVDMRVEGLNRLYPEIPAEGIRKFFVGEEAKEEKRDVLIRDPEGKLEPMMVSEADAVKLTTPEWGWERG